MDFPVEDDLEAIDVDKSVKKYTDKGYKLTDILTTSELILYYLTLED